MPLPEKRSGCGFTAVKCKKVIVHTAVLRKEKYLELKFVNIFTNVYLNKGVSMKTLRDAKVGETVKVVKLNGEGPVRKRIMDMGITKGVEIFIRKVAPLGDPVEVNVRGFELTLRKDEAERIVIE